VYVSLSPPAAQFPSFPLEWESPGLEKTSEIIQSIYHQYFPLTHVPQYNT